MNALEKLAAWMATAEPVDAPLALARAGDAVIDTLACVLSSKDEEVVASVAATVTANVNAPCTLPGLPCAEAADAALVNGTAAHAQDFDDYHSPSVAHASAVLVPAVVAVAECLDAGGRRVLDAYVVGLQAMAVLGNLLNMDHYLHGWHATSTVGTVGAAAACARLYGLDAARCEAALSLATSMGGGFLCQAGFMAKPLHAGLAAQGGSRAASLARAGVTASADAFDGPRGALRLWTSAQHRPPAAAATDFSKYSIETDGLCVKPYPCCGYVTRSVDAALAVAGRDDFCADEIKAVHLSVPDRHLEVVSYHAPANVLQARFSFPFCIAAALVRGRLAAASFSPQNLADPAVRKLMTRITLEGYPADPAIADGSAQIPDTLSVEFNDGRTLTKTVGQPRGSPAHPFGTGTLLAKLWENNRHREIHERRQSLDEKLLRLAELNSIREVTALLQPAGAAAAWCG